MPAPSLARPDGAPALVLAHRGAWDPAPQNSAAAFEQAIADGADGVELDVRRTGDGRLAVVHDARIGWRAVSRTGLAELRTRMAPGQAPELDATLAALAGRIAVDVELKEDGYVAEALAVVRDALPAGSYVVTSFLDEVIAQVRELAPEVRTGLLVGPGRAAGRPERLRARLRETGAEVLVAHVSLLRGGVLELAAAEGRTAWLWTVNEAAQCAALRADPRVAAIITDRPRMALAT